MFLRFTQVSGTKSDTRQYVLEIIGTDVRLAPKNADVLYSTLAIGSNIDECITENIKVLKKRIAEKIASLEQLKIKNNENTDKVIKAMKDVII